MRYKYKLIAYIIALNSTILGVGIYYTHEDKIAFLIVELIFVIFLILGINLYRQFSKPFDLLAAGTESLKDQDFSMRLKAVKNKEFNTLIEVYNKMIEQLRRERIALSEKNFLLTKLMEASPSGILIFDFDDHLQTMNQSAEKYLGKPIADIKGKSLKQLSETSGNIFDELTHNKNYIFRKSGSQLLRIQTSSFVDRGFETRFILLEDMSHEIYNTEKHSYEKVIRMMSHEVNNSVAAVNSMLQTIQPKIEQKRYAEAMDVCIQRNENMNRFMRNFASVVRIPAPDFKQVDLNDLLKNVLVLFSNEIQERNIKLHSQLREEPLWENCDKSQIEQVVLNVLKNAKEAILESGDITVETQTKPTTIILRNNGAALTIDEQKSVFTPFYTTKEKGQGIGLTLVREILLNHNCTFNLHSHDKQTEFIIVFPVS